MSATAADASITKKRGRDELDESALDARPFTVKPDASDPFAAPRTFTPICLLSRAQLPLSYLDTSATGSRLLTAHVHALEAAHDYDDDATVLVAFEAKDKTLYAIERVKARVYALCGLGGWVREEDVRARSKLVLRDGSQVKRRALQVGEKGGSWWMSAALDMPDGKHYDATRTMPNVNTRPPSEDATAYALPVCEDAIPDAGAGRLGADDEAILEAAPQTVTEALQELIKQYLEALYLSRTSLAYFTKGPLSRARAAFAVMPGAATNELVESLRSSILTSSTMDKKFKDKLPAAVKDIAPTSAVSPAQPKKTKRTRKWKAKRDKHGFFSDEKDAVERWWLDHDASQSASSTAESTDQALRRRLPKLRSRETFMQLILILETLALEAALPRHGAKTAQAESQNMDAAVLDEETQAQDNQDVAEAQSLRPKKKQDLPALLETLLDKLCIWHSLESHSPAKKSAADGGEADEVSDELKSFCLEIVVPFYISRIPQHATVINKKLGGPTAPTPVKRRSTVARKPGEPAVRQAPEKKPRKPLSRPATDTLNGRGRPVLALNRSATDSDALSAYIKREHSEVPMDGIPRKPRQSLMQSLNSSRRQVDLSAMSQANDAKMQKRAEVQEKMQSAINMLRKPNRTAALADVRSQTDESFAKATAAAKGRSQRRTATGQRPHVAATPSHARTVQATPYRRAAVEQPGHLQSSSGTTHVPSTSARLPQGRDLVPSGTFAVPQTGHRPRQTAQPRPHSGIEETPSRGFAKFMPPGLAREPGTLESPTASRKVAATPSKSVKCLNLGVTATPQATGALVAASPNVQRSDVGAGKAMEAPKSIYDSLGWEDEYEELT